MDDVDYLIAIESRNSIEAKINIEIFGGKYSTNAIIDTGAMVSVISLRDIFNDYHTLREIKLEYIRSNVPYYFTRGIAGSLYDTTRRDEEYLLNNPEIDFKYRVKSMANGSYTIIKDGVIGINFDSEYGSLIGMDILNKMHIHCGKCRTSDTYIFMGCLENDLPTRKRYYKDLKEFFNIEYCNSYDNDIDNKSNKANNGLNSLNKLASLFKK